MYRTLFLGSFLLGLPVVANAFDNDVMPVPALAQRGQGRLALTGDFTVAFKGTGNPRVKHALDRALLRVEQRTGLTFARSSDGEYLAGRKPGDSSLVIECESLGNDIPALGEDESYALAVSPTQAKLHAANTLGAMHGLETLLQLVQSDADGWFIPAVSIEDRPRFPWRGLMIDVCRHWQPMEVIKRNLDGMALVKLNVLHLHLTEDQGFRIESKLFPRLQQLGSDGHFFTQEEMRDLIRYAAERGIRVVPEFDIPGHATSWVVAYPELASAPGPYVIERKWGVKDPVLDPTNPQVYDLLEGFLGEMADLFPDPYLHIGGDENNGVQWNANPRIQAFIREHSLGDNAGLHTYFNGKIHAILAKHGKKLTGWDEILHAGLPAGSVVQSWRGPDGIAAATRQGFPAVLSNGYYIDLCYTARAHYLNDPAPEDATLTDDQRKLVLGGEATMWSEWVTPETIDSRTWPRTAAIAERLWSPAGVRDVPDMYRRLAVVSRRLEEAGLRHEGYLDPALRRLAGDGASGTDLAALRVFVDVLEPVKHYERGRQQPDHTQFTPLNGLADCSRPDSAASRDFSERVEAVIRENNIDEGELNRLVETLAAWNSSADRLTNGLAAKSPRLEEALPLLRSWSVAIRIGRDSIESLRTGKAASPEALKSELAELELAALPHAAAELPIINSIRRLAVAAAIRDQRRALDDEAWLRRLNELTGAEKPATSRH